MLFKRRKKRIEKHRQAWLYSAVYAGRFSTLLVLLLFCAFVTQPLHQALASEPAPSESPTPVAADVQPQVQESPPAEESPPPDASPPEPSINTPPPEPVDQTATSSSPAESDNPPPAQNPDEQADTDVATTSDLALSQQDPNSSSTEVVKIQSLVTDENYYQFSKQSCVEVGGGVYNCTSRKEEVDNSQSVVYSERDAGGDMEIFLKTSKGSVKQITENDYDDTSPNYDAESMRIVWQRQVDGRSQIVEYDIMDEIGRAHV